MLIEDDSNAVGVWVYSIAFQPVAIALRAAGGEIHLDQTIRQGDTAVPQIR